MSPATVCWRSGGRPRSCRRLSTTGTPKYVLGAAAQSGGSKADDAVRNSRKPESEAGRLGGAVSIRSRSRVGTSDSQVGRTSSRQAQNASGSRGGIGHQGASRGQGRVQNGDQAMDVGQWHDCDGPILGTKTERLDYAPDRRRQIAAAQRDELGFAGRARRLEQKSGFGRAQSAGIAPRGWPHGAELPVTRPRSRRGRSPWARAAVAMSAVQGRIGDDEGGPTARAAATARPPRCRDRGPRGWWLAGRAMRRRARPRHEVPERPGRQPSPPEPRDRTGSARSAQISSLDVPTDLLTGTSCSEVQVKNQRHDRIAPRRVTAELTPTLKPASF